ncbi:hypothetical protein Q428_12335 [Fervidicella metallireducens AeB]|uniref:ATPase AAA-type core domain-containing protein n=1 Tax=Fervidicella metallireducens AeB TaxID=1403537 RepID=A0A017RS98_9CLOT|nr:hypothetical protein [Fervidicella metallireducens]EYE87618.1 hypothetical protein Q428_12335 [Fervidicella metallireducens AeB]
MCEKKINTWLSSLLRESGFRKSIILYGNVGDICYNSDSGKYELIINLIENKLRGTGFEEVVRWDLVDGIRTQLNNYDYIDELYKQSIEEDVINNENLNDTGGSNYFSDNEMDCIQKEQSSYNIDLENFFNIVYKSMVKRTSKKTAFIVDWSNYIFGNANSLSEKERKYLTVIGKAIRNAPTDLDYKSIDRPANILILITNNIGAIPPAYYQNNPAVKTINIPIPGRLEREKYLMDNIDKFKLDRLLRPKDREFVDFVDLLDGFTIRDINQMIKLSRQIENPLSPEKLVNLYKYGEQNSPWENLSKEKIRDIDEVLKKRVKGQDEAINKVKKVIIRAFTGFSGIQHSSKLKNLKGFCFLLDQQVLVKQSLLKHLLNFYLGMKMHA